VSDVVVVAVPYDGHDELVASLPLAGKTVISCVNPLAFDKRGARPGHRRRGGLRSGVRRRAPAGGHGGRRVPQRLRRGPVG